MSEEKNILNQSKDDLEDQILNNDNLPSEEQPPELEQEKESKITDASDSAQLITVQGNVDSQFNITSLHTLNLINSNKDDPTKDYPTEHIKECVYYSDQEVDIYARKLVQERLLFIYSYSEDATNSAISALLNRPEFNNLDRRLLPRIQFESFEVSFDEHVGQINKKESKSGAEKLDQVHQIPEVYKTGIEGISSLDNLLSRNINKEQPSIIVAESDSYLFLDSILNCSEINEASNRQQLAKKGLYLIVKVDKSRLIKFLQDTPTSKSFPQWLVSSWRFKLYNKFEAIEAQKYISGIEIQYKHGLWDEGATEQTLSKAIEAYLARGKSRFISEFYDRQNILENPDSEAARAADEKKRQLAPEVFLSRSNNPVAFHLAFVGAWFKKMTVTEFDSLCFHIFNDTSKTHEIGRKTKRIKNEDGSIETLDEPDTRSLLEIWNGREDEFRAEAHLITVKPQDSSYRYVEFDDPFLYDSVRTFFEEKYASFAAKNFDLIFRVAFFEEDASPNLIENLAELNAQMARQEPSRALSRLTDISFNIHRAEKRSDLEAEQQWRNASDLNEIFQLLEQKGEFQRLKYLFYHRIYLLVSEFWVDSELREVSEKFFEWLLRQGSFEPMYFLSKQLWDTQDFKPLYWVRQLIERGDETAKNSAFRLLVNKLSQETSGYLWEYMKELYTGLPDTKLTTSQYSRFNEYTLAFLIHFVANTANESKPATAKGLPLLAPLFYKNGEENEYWKKLLSWLFHPGIGTAMVRVNRDYQFQNPNQLRAWVLGEWFWLIHGSEEPLSGDAEWVIHNMIDTMPQVTSLKDYRLVLEPLREQARDYRERREDRPRTYALQYFIQLLRDLNPFAG
ncbi:MAG: hypothetical protein R2791_12505 [Saprospiraceae bacterium]|nr:hypothetical protein [Lewinellaceae bacterium]